MRPTSRTTRGTTSSPLGGELSSPQRAVWARDGAQRTASLGSSGSEPAGPTQQTPSTACPAWLPLASERYGHEFALPDSCTSRSQNRCRRVAPRVAPRISPGSRKTSDEATTSSTATPTRPRSSRRRSTNSAQRSSAEATKAARRERATIPINATVPPGFRTGSDVPRGDSAGLWTRPSVACPCCDNGAEQHGTCGDQAGVQRHHRS